MRCGEIYITSLIHRCYHLHEVSLSLCVQRFTYHEGSIARYSKVRHNYVLRSFDIGIKVSICMGNYHDGQAIQSFMGEYIVSDRLRLFFEFRSWLFVLRLFYSCLDFIFLVLSRCSGIWCCPPCRIVSGIRNLARLLQWSRRLGSANSANSGKGERPISLP